MRPYEEEVRKIIDKHLDEREAYEEAIGWDTDLRIAGVDSITFVKLVVELEIEFDIEFPEEKLLFSEADTIGKICGIIESANNVQ